MSSNDHGDDPTPADENEKGSDGDLSVGQHVRSTSEGQDPGVYRVVGADDRVALLRLTDENGRREFTGELSIVDAATIGSDFEPADDPDEEVDPILEFRNVVSGMYWTVRGLLPR